MGINEFFKERTGQVFYEKSDWKIIALAGVATLGVYTFGTMTLGIVQIDSVRNNAKYQNMSHEDIEAKIESINEGDKFNGFIDNILYEPGRHLYYLFED